MKQIFLVLIASQSIFAAGAQINTDTAILHFQAFLSKACYEDPTLRDKTHFKEWIIPSAMILYGAMATHVDDFTDLDENIKNEIWDKYPHQTASIDNYLQFVPAAAVYGLNVAGIHGAHNYMDLTVIYLMSNVIMSVTVYTVKNVTHEQRPNGADYQCIPFRPYG
jgi:hypothetical protein